MTRPSNDAIAQAFWETCALEPEYHPGELYTKYVVERAREIDAWPKPSDDAQWVTVPREPTEAMVDAGTEQHQCAQGDPFYSEPDLSYDDAVRVYKAMIEAAPTPPKQERYMQWTPQGGVRVDIDAYLKSDEGKAALAGFTVASMPKQEPVAWQSRHKDTDGRWLGWGQHPSEEEAAALCDRYRELGFEAEYRKLYDEQPPPTTDDDVRRDAERYRWLRENPEHGSTPYFEAGEWHAPYLMSNAGGFGDGVGRRTFTSLDEAIDAAIREASTTAREDVMSKSKAKRVAAQKGESSDA